MRGQAKNRFRMSMKNVQTRGEEILVIEDNEPDVLDTFCFFPIKKYSTSQVSFLK
jgi:hypothetical protein